MCIRFSLVPLLAACSTIQKSEEVTLSPSVVQAVPVAENVHTNSTELHGLTKEISKKPMHSSIDLMHIRLLT